MHIAFWSPAWPLQKFQNGIITYVHWMKRELEAQGHRVSVLTGNLDAESDASNVYLAGRDEGLDLSRALIKHVRWRRPGYREIFEFGADIARAIMKVHRQHAIDIIEMEESFGWFADVARLTSLPVLVKLHGPAFLSMVDNELVSPLGIKRIEREGQALAQFDSIVAPSSLILRQTLDRYQLQPRDAQCIVNPLVMDERTPLWSLESCDNTSVLFVGRFDLRKGGDIVLKAFALAARQHKALRLVFVGPDVGVTGTDGRTVHFNEFRDSVMSADVRARVDFRGRMANEEILVMRTRSVVTVVASRWENQGYALLEAMFQGCPIVCTDAGGCPESIADGITGLLAKSGDPESFSRQILALANDPGRAEELGRTARLYAVKEHAADKVVESALKTYAHVIQAHRAADSI